MEVNLVGKNRKEKKGKGKENAKKDCARVPVARIMQRNMSMKG
jgi:hypothetical protein